MDTYIINDDNEVIRIVNDEDNDRVVISEDVVSVSDNLETAQITVLNDVVSVIDSDDSITLSDSTDTVEVSFEGGISQTTIINQFDSEDDVPLNEEVDFVDDDVIYKGWADEGTTMDQALWRIQKITFINDEGDVRKRYANDNSGFIHIWNDRATFDYSNT